MVAEKRIINRTALEKILVDEDGKGERLEGKGIKKIEGNGTESGIEAASGKGGGEFTGSLTYYHHYTITPCYSMNYLKKPGASLSVNFLHFASHLSTSPYSIFDLYSLYAAKTCSKSVFSIIYSLCWKVSNSQYCVKPVRRLALGSLILNCYISYSSLGAR